MRGRAAIYTYGAAHQACVQSLNPSERTRGWGSWIFERWRSRGYFLLNAVSDSLAVARLGTLWSVASVSWSVESETRGVKHMRVLVRSKTLERARSHVIVVLYLSERVCRVQSTTDRGSGSRIRMAWLLRDGLLREPI